MIRRVATLLAASLLVACTGGEPTGVVDEQDAAEETGIAPALLEQRVLIAQGAEVQAGVLLQACDGGSCTRLGQPSRQHLRVTDSRPILTITLGRQPDSVEARLRTDSQPGPVEALKAGTLVAWRPKVPPGRHDVRLTAAYGAVSLTFSFSVVRE